MALQANLAQAAVLALIGAVMAVAMGCTCATVESVPPPDGTPGASLDRPAVSPLVTGSPRGAQPVILLVSRISSGAATDANVAGVLEVSPEGCVTVADYVLVAPPGSAVTDHGVHLEGIGDMAIGQRIAMSGGVVELDMIPVGMRPAGYEQCEAVELAVISAP